MFLRILIRLRFNILLLTEIQISGTLVNYQTLVKKNKIKKQGIVLEALPAGSFRVKLEDGKEALCHLAGKLRIYRIRVLTGDRVTVEFSPYDETRGRIVYRNK